MAKFFVTLVTLFLATNVTAQENTIWGLPQSLSDKNTEVSFEVDTTWHIVYGKITGTSGSIKLSDVNNPLTVVSDIHFPTKNFNTGWDKRDDNLHEHMKVEQFPEVILKTSAVQGECSPQAVNKADCAAKLVGTLTICDITKDIEIPVTISKKEQSYKINGEYSFKWADYNVDDPSIIVAKVDPVVKVIYSVTLPAVTK